MKTATKWTVPLLVALLSATSLIAAPSEEQTGKIKGEVVAVRQATQTQNQGEFTEIRVLTRNQEQLWLRLGPQAEYGAQVRVGDRVKAQIRRQGDGEPALVQNMYNYRTRSRIQVRNDGGELVPLQQQTRMRAGYGSQGNAGECTGTQQQNRDRRGQSNSGGGGGKSQGGGGGNGGGRGGR